MIVHIFVSTKTHPAIPSLSDINNKQIKIEIFDQKDQLIGGDILIAYHATTIIPKKIYENYKYRLVLHASKLPDGGGWSPLNWSILNGDLVFWLSLIEMTEQIDAGAIIFQVNFKIEPHMLLLQAMKILCNEEIKLIEKFLEAPAEFWNTRKKIGSMVNYLPRRSPQDSQVDITKSILEQFNIFRASDNERYPVFFYHLGHKYTLKIYLDDYE